MDFLFTRLLDRSHRLEAYTESWQIDHQKAMRIRDLEELISEALEGAPLVRRAWDHAIEQMFETDEKGEKNLEVEDLVLQVIQRVVRAFRRLEKLIAVAEEAHYSIERVDEVRNQLRDLEMLEQEARQQWCSTNPQQMRESLEAYVRGEYQLAEDMLRELQSRGSDAH